MTEFRDIAVACGNSVGKDVDLDFRVKLAIATDMIARGASKDEVVAAVSGDLGEDALPYTVSIDAARRAVPDGHSFAVGDCDEDGNCWACVTNDKTGVDSKWHGTTPAGTLTAAAIFARALSSARQRNTTSEGLSGD